MEKIRTYGVADVRRAVNTLNTVRAIARNKKNLLRGESHNEVVYTQASLLADRMRLTHSNWVDAKFEPRISALQRTSEDRDKSSRSLEEHYGNGLKMAISMHSKAQLGEFDIQDAIVSYTASFLTMLKICGSLDVAPGNALKLAQRSYILNGSTLIHGLREYEGRFTRGTIIKVAVSKPSSFQRYLLEASDRVVEIATHTDYRQIPLPVIAVAVMEHDKNPKAYLDEYKRRLAAKVEAGPIQHIIFEKKERKSSQRSFVPIEINKAGAALKRAIDRNDIVTEGYIAATAGVAEDALVAFENGELVDINPFHLYQSASEWIYKENEHMLEFDNQLRVLNWLRTLTQDKKTPKDKILGRGIRLLQLSTSKTGKEFAEERPGGTNPQLSRWKGGRTLYQSDLDTIFLKSGIHLLGPDNKVMQFLCLKTVDRSRDNRKDPMSLDDLQTCTFGDLMKYLRRLKGLTQTDLAKAIKNTRGRVKYYENDNFVTINETIIDRFITSFGLDSNPNSALASIIRQKALKSMAPIADEVLQKVLTEQYLFQEHLNQLDPYLLSEEDTDLQPWIKDMPIGKKIRFMRMRKSLGVKEFAQLAGVGVTTVTQIESCRKIPKDYILLKLTKPLGYDVKDCDIHNPIMLSMVDQIEEERKAT